MLNVTLEICPDSIFLRNDAKCMWIALAIFYGRGESLSPPFPSSEKYLSHLFSSKNVPVPPILSKRSPFTHCLAKSACPFVFAKKNPWLSFFKKTLGTLVVRANQSFYKFWVVLNGLHIFWIKLSYGAGQRLFSPLRGGSKIYWNRDRATGFFGGFKKSAPRDFFLQKNFLPRDFFL